MSRTAAVLTLLIGATVALAGPPAQDTPKGAKDEDPTDALGANAACYVCHQTFVKEELARSHLTHAVTCIKCHGPSDKHANDENIGATKPDILIPRAKVDASCTACHKSHDVAPARVLARFVERRLPAAAQPVCTECHGSHRIARAAETSTAPPAAPGK